MELGCWTYNTHKEIAEYANGLLWRFVLSNAKHIKTHNINFDLNGISKNDIEFLSSIHFILSDEIQIFIKTLIPKIINKMSKQIKSNKAIERNIIKGVIHWGETYKARSILNGDSSIFIYSSPSTNYNIDDNRLFIFILNKIDKISKSLITNEEIEKSNYSEKAKKEKWKERVIDIYHRVSSIKGLPFYSHINPYPNISKQDIERLRKSRYSYYRDLANTLTCYLNYSLNKFEFLQTKLKVNLLEPLNSDVLYELAVTFKVMSILDSNGWKEISKNLIKKDKEYLSYYKKNDCTIKIYTQQLPHKFTDISLYANLLNEYQMTKSLRRPDIILEIEKSSEQYFLILEVKRSEDKKYILDGVYKVLGYLKDFEKAKNLSAVLVSWKNCFNYKEYNEDICANICDWESCNDVIRSCLSKYET